jgi:hypothetical protein
VILKHFHSHDAQFAVACSKGEEEDDRNRKRSQMHGDLSLRLSDAGLRRRTTRLLYSNHRLPPWLNGDAPRDRSNRLSDALPCAFKSRESLDRLTGLPMNFIRYYPHKFGDYIALRPVEEPNALPPI